VQYIVLVAVAIYVSTHAGGITKFLQEKGWLKVVEGTSTIQIDKE
jgi:hypothetical protein